MLDTQGVSRDGGPAQAARPVEEVAQRNPGPPPKHLDNVPRPGCATMAHSREEDGSRIRPGPGPTAVIARAARQPDAISTV